jgi:hypothetical protein
VADRCGFDVTAPQITPGTIAAKAATNAAILIVVNDCVVIFLKLSSPIDKNRKKKTCTIPRP